MNGRIIYWQKDTRPYSVFQNKLNEARELLKNSGYVATDLASWKIYTVVISRGNFRQEYTGSTKQICVKCKILSKENSVENATVKFKQTAF